MRWKLCSLLCQAHGETLLLKKLHFCLKKKKVCHCVLTLQVTKATEVAFHKVLVLLQVRKVSEGSGL